MNIKFGRPSWGESAVLLVPKLEYQDKWARFALKGGSSIVGFVRSADDAGRYVVYFEGNVYDAVNLQTFKDRAVCAYGRMTHSYPTVAMTTAALEEMEIVGSVSNTTFSVVPGPALNAWLALDPSVAALLAGLPC